MILLFFIAFADFNGDGKPDNITFMIKRIKVHNMNALKDPTYRYPGNYGVEKFLELFSGMVAALAATVYLCIYVELDGGKRSSQKRSPDWWC